MYSSLNIRTSSLRLDPDLEPGDVRGGVRLGGALPAVRAQALPCDAASGEVCEELPR